MLFVQALKYKVVLGRTLCKHCSTKWYWKKAPGESLVVQSSTQSTLCKLCSTGRYFAQALQYKCKV